MLTNEFSLESSASIVVPVSREYYSFLYLKKTEQLISKNVGGVRMIVFGNISSAEEMLKHVPGIIR
ncbi:MAG: hypothetical protein RBT65_02140 [Methanolobus sp.]|nr:hypothetical protein [Methanolobus sp.]